MEFDWDVLYNTKLFVIRICLYARGRQVCHNVMETECQPTVCKSAHQCTAICLAFSSFPASVFTLLEIKRSLTHQPLDKMIPLIPQTPVR